MYVLAGSTRLWVRDEGLKSGQAVLLLHGFPDSHALWDAQVRALADAGHRAIAPDMPGYGRSDKPPGLRAYSLQAVVTTLAALLDALGVERAAVVGHDWGAATAWRFAMVLPQRTARLAVLSTGHPGAGMSVGGLRQRQLWWYMLFFQHPQADACLQENDWTLARELFGQGEPAQVMDAYVQALSQPGALQGALSWYRANFRPEAFGQTKPRAMPTLRMPVLGIWGSRDPVLLEEQMTASKEYVAPGMWRYERMESAGHWIPRDAGRRLNEVLLSFLAARPGATGAAPASRM